MSQSKLIVKKPTVGRWVGNAGPQSFPRSENTSKDRTTADRYHDKAARIYRRIIENAIKKAGNRARMCEANGLPVSTVKKALETGAYLMLRNTAHKVK